jgi:CHASE3 domain sensor protein
MTPARKGSRISQGAADASAVPSRIDTLASLTQDNPIQQANLGPVRRHVDANLKERKETIDLRGSKGSEAAPAVMITDGGKLEMDAIRAQLEVMRQAEIRPEPKTGWPAGC